MSKIESNKIEAFGKCRYSKFMYGDLYDDDFIKWVDYIRNNILKVDYKIVINDINNIVNGELYNKKNINKFYFDQIRFETYFNTDKFNIDECISSLEIMRYIYNWCNHFIKCYPKKDLISDFYNFFRLSGIRTARLAGDYGCKNIDYILKKYNYNGIYYDPSAGWGSRMIIAAKNNIEYITTDPNNRLIRKLNMLAEDINRSKSFNYKLINSGSEVYNEYINNKVGLIFTSPPYDNLEMYNNGLLTFDDYSKFVDDSVDNFSKYIVNNGFIIINIDDRNYNKWFNSLSRYFNFICNESISFNVIRNRKTNYKPKKERIMVFRNMTKNDF